MKNLKELKTIDEFLYCYHNPDKLTGDLKIDTIHQMITNKKLSISFILTNDQCVEFKTDSPLPHEWEKYVS